MLAQNRKRRIVMSNGSRVFTEDSILNNPRNQRLLREIQKINRNIVTNRLQQTPKLKISYCTTCFNRFWQLSKILKPNLNQVKGDPDVEFVVVDFHGNDTQKIHDFITSNFPEELASGKLKYFQRRGDIKPFKWNVAIAKNVAHRLATGDVLVNLDGDNFIQPQDSRILRYYFNQIPKMVFQQTWCNIALINMFRSLGLRSENYDVDPWAIYGTNRGTYGRIAMIRQEFFKLGGYNEQMINMGNQDTDLIFRAIHTKHSDLVSVPRSDGSPKASIVNQSDIQRPQLNHNRGLTKKAFKQRQFIVNQDGFVEDLGNYRQIVGLAETKPVESKGKIARPLPSKPTPKSKQVIQTLCPHCGEYHSDEE